MFVDVYQAKMAIACTQPELSRALRRRLKKTRRIDWGSLIQFGCMVAEKGQQREIVTKHNKITGDEETTKVGIRFAVQCTKQPGCR
jgi:hypothetical protein